MNDVEPFKLNVQQMATLPFVLGLTFTILDALYNHSAFDVFALLYLFFLYTLLATLCCVGLGVGFLFQLEDAKACTGMCTLGTFITFIIYLTKDFSFFEATQRGIIMGLLLSLLTGLGLKVYKMYT